MEEIVSDAISQDFMAICEQTGMRAVGQRLLASLQEKGAGSDTILTQLTNRVVNGTKEELNKFVNRGFQLPLGLRVHLTRLLCTKVRESTESVVIKSKQKSKISQSYQQFLILLRDWRKGSSPPDALFRHINDLVVNGTVGVIEAQRITNLILEEGGYANNQLTLLHGRSQICSAICNMLEISGVFTGPNTLIVYASSGSHIELQPSQLRRSEIYFTTSTSMQSTPEIWWEHVGASDHLQFLSRGLSAASSGSSQDAEERGTFHHDLLSPANIYLDQVHSKPTLIIGDTIRMQEASIEVSQVIMVDSLSPDCTAPVLRFAVLLEGALSAGTASSCSVRSPLTSQVSEMEVCDPYRDGDTDVNSPRSHGGQGSHSSADSNDDENYNNIPPLETQKRYLAVFISVLDTIPVVECFCPLLDNILHDQIPTSIRMIAPGLAVVSGSNGLLGLVHAGTHAKLNASAAYAKSTPTVTKHHGGHRSSFAFCNLVEDSLQPELPEGFILSHRGDAAITAVDHVATAPDSAILVSGDDAGRLCVWEVNTSAGMAKLLCPAHQVDSAARRVVSVQVSTSGSIIAVGLLDRLLLLGINKPDGSNSRLASTALPNLYVRSCLDMLCGTVHARYAVTFFADCIRIWRIVNEARSRGPQAISYKSELDSYADTEIDGQPPESDRDNRQLDGRRSRLGTVYGEENLGTFSVDPDMHGAEIGGERSIDLGARDNSPTNPQSPNPPPGPPAALHSSVAADATVEYTTGISVTTWLHFNVDAFQQRYASTLEELEERFGDPDVVDVVDCKARTPPDRRAGTPTWLEVPTVDSPLTELFVLNPPTGLERSDSGSSGNMSSYTADGTVAIDNQPAQQRQPNSQHPVDPIPQHEAASLDLNSNSQSFESDTESHQSPQLQYVHMDDEFMPLYAPAFEQSPPVPDLSVPPIAPPPPPYGPQPATDVVEHSDAIPGMQVRFGDGVVQFQQADQRDPPQTTTVHVHLPEVLPHRTSLAHADMDASAPAGPSVVLDHTARHHSHFSLYGMVRPFRSFSRRRQPDLQSLQQMTTWFQHDTSEKFCKVKGVLAVLCACYQTPSIGIVAAALEVSTMEVAKVVQGDLRELLHVNSDDKRSVITLRSEHKGLLKWLCLEHSSRVGSLFWIDAALGHNILCSLYLRYCGNKSVAVEHTWQDYLRTYGPTHLRHASRGLRLLTENIRKIDETANIRVHLPRQIGYVVGLYEIYARRVGLRGRIPAELGQLQHLRVLSMGNNHLSGELPASLGQLKNLQRIVLHQNNLRGPVPQSLGDLGCIVNLAGNPLLHHGDDVPAHERQALVDLYGATRGAAWSTKTYWCTNQPVAKWYKVGVLTSHVHSIVMSSNGMEGKLPTSVSQLTFLRMIELATMPGLIGIIPKELCTISTLRRLCICRCGLTGRIPTEIGKLVCLEELQLFGNQLSGSVPASISNLTNLKLLSLGEYTGGNNFTAEPLPSCLSALVNLEALFMANCNIRGPLPDWLGDLTELRQLDLQRNQLSGAVPVTIGKLQNLLYLNIKDNQQLTGRLPLTQLLSLNKLNRLSLVHCNFLDTDHALEALKTHLPRCKVWI